LMETSDLVRTLAVLPPGKSRQQPLVGAWVGFRAGRDLMKKREIFSPAGERSLIA
jgi:hypothetical protein